MALHNNGSGNAAVPDAIVVRDLHKSFGNLEVLKGISLSAKQGEVVAIIGGSGSGKSTLLRCINFLELPTAGEIEINGEFLELRETPQGLLPRDKKQLQRVRADLAMVFQSFNLWRHMTILQNVTEVPIHVLGVPKAQAIETAEQMLERVGLSDKHDAYPFFLSGGQQQRAAIARALAVSPKAMLFDEPTSALDPELVGEVLKVIKDIAKEGRTMVLVTHEMNFARDVADRIVFMHQGVIAEEGPAKEVIDNPQSDRLRKFLETVR